MSWMFKQVGQKPKLNKPILIEGLPGIGNVGKIALDFIIDELKAKKLYSVFSRSFPHSVFVNENNLVELPSIEIYCKKFNDNRNDLLLLVGDIQPLDEVSCYEFCEKVLDIAKKFKVTEIITLGGIGLQAIPKTPKVYCTGNNKKTVDKYKEYGVCTKLYGIVGPIVGVSGILPGLAKKSNINGVALLAETLGHPLFLGIKGARSILKVLDKRLKLGIKISALDKEIKAIEAEMKKAIDLSHVQTNIKRAKKEVSYIG